RAQSASTVGGIVKAVFLLEPTGPHAGVPQQLDVASRSLMPVDWPAPFEAWRTQIQHVAPLAPGLLPPALLADSIDAKTPALVVPVPTIKRIENGGRLAVMPDPAGVVRTIVVWLDGERIRQPLLAGLVAQHFGAGDTSEYVVAIVTRDPQPQVVYAS